MDNKLIKGLSITVASLVVMAGSIAIIPSKVSASTDNNKPKLTYCAHVQDYGWDKICKTVGEVSNLSVQSPSINEVVGTEGESRRMEALEINVDAPNGVTVKYRTHVQDYGWMDWITADNKVGTYFAGTTGESRRMEALQIAVEGDIDYEIKYRAHVQDYGWMNWVNACSSINTATLEMGNYVGTVGESRRMEALQIVVVPNKHEEIEASHTHNFTNWTTKVPATCNTHGTEERKCTICGKTETQQTSAFH